MPVFIGLAEELAKDGFIARAIAALKRVEKLDPGQPHVEARLAALARQGGRTAAMLPTATPLPLKPPPPSRPELEIGIEEVGSETLVRLVGDRARRAAKIGEEPSRPRHPPMSPPPPLPQLPHRRRPRLRRSRRPPGLRWSLP
ncbi:MAG: hypothetical protein DMF79_11120 [Acidobacteria bacterium]|nr:MAG: hypothetical protein DMF79_11120 [Acidobacteriota bacterium]